MQQDGSETIWILIAGSTNPMQTLLANARLLFHYHNGSTDTLDLVPPANFWSLSPYGGVDYDYARDAFCLPATPPPAVQLGNNHRAMVYSWTLPQGASLSAVTLETLSSDVVIGLLGLSLAYS